MTFFEQQKQNSKSRALAQAAILAGMAFIVGLGLGLGISGKRADVAWGRNEASLATGTQPMPKVTGIGSRPPRGLAKEVDFSLFWEVWKDLKAQFYEQPVDDKTLFYGALRGMAESLGDPYTNYFEPKEAEEFDQSLKGEFSGIGAEIGMKDGQLQIIAPLPDSPAEKAGIKARDLILKINDEESLAMPVDQAVSKIRGPKGTQVKLQLARPKPSKDTKAKPEYESLDLTITRDTIVVKSVKLKDVKDGLAVIEIRNFNADVEESFREAVDKAIDKGAKGVVIDLRNNPGGYLDKAIAVAGEWVNDNVVVEQRERGEIVSRYKGEGRGLLKHIPTVVLVNEGSASAAEIVAGALQDYGIAMLVGKKTFGKGSVQDYREYDDGSGVKITIAEWLTPKGRSINKEGIAPDSEVELTTDDINADRDPQLDKALELLRTGRSKPTATPAE